MIISIAGNILSGKSTLAKKICSLYGYEYVPSKRNELNFLDDFFENIPAHFFATQTSFLVSKALEIEELVNKGCNIVIDRSLFEDINIFAQLWMDNYNEIDMREKILYKDLSNYIMRNIPKTEMYIYCKCKLSTLEERFKNRKHRSFENKYPKDYLQQLYEKYNKIEFPKDSIVVEVESERINFTNDNDVIDMMISIERQLNSIEERSQLSFLDEESTIEKFDPYIKVINPSLKSVVYDFEVKKKTIYIAAPFSEFAKEEQVNSCEEILTPNIRRDYYVLPTKYQNFLNRIKRIITSIDEYKVILPHKDENNWGKSYITNEQIVTSMIKNISESDLIVAIISNSIGVYMEIAMMAILNKPMLLFIVDDLSNGFYANGFRNRKRTLVIDVKSMKDVELALKKDKIINFIRGELKDGE